MSEFSASQRQMDLVFQALDEGLEVLRKQENLVPFAYLLTKEGVVLRRFVGASMSESLSRAAEMLAQLDDDVLAYALVYDVVMTIEEHEYDALMIETDDREQAHGLRFAQRYQPTTSDNPLYTIGQLAYLGTYEGQLS